MLPPTVADGSSVREEYVDVEGFSWDEIGSSINMRDVYLGVAGTVALAVMILGGVFWGRKLLSSVKTEGSSHAAADKQKAQKR